MVAKVLCMTSSLPRDKDQGIISGSSSYSRDGPDSSPSFARPDAFLLYFCTGATGSGTGSHTCGSGCRPRDLLLPSKVLSSTEKSSTDTGQAPTHHRDFCLSGIPKLTRDFPQAFHQLVRISHLLMAENPNHLATHLLSLLVKPGS